MANRKFGWHSGYIHCRGITILDGTVGNVIQPGVGLSLNEASHTISGGAVTGLWQTMTISGNHTASTAGFRSYVQTDATARTITNLWAGVFRSTLKVGDIISGGNTVLYANMDLGANTTLGQSTYILQLDYLDISSNRATVPHAFMGFQDWAYSGSYPVAYLMDIGMGGAKIGTGSTKIFMANSAKAYPGQFIGTLKVRINNADYWIPLNSAEYT
jgi:hypothetical protein